MTAREVRKRNVGSISEFGMCIRPGQMLAMAGDGYPLIVATGRSEAILAHARNTHTISTILTMFRTLGVPVPEVSMSIQMFAPQYRGDYFVERALQAGLRHVWAVCSIGEFFAQQHVIVGQMSHITVTRFN